MEFLKMYKIHNDARGVFNGITNKYSWSEINYIETKKGVIRGKHYHKFTKELFYILEGEIEISVLNLTSHKEHAFIAKQYMSFIIDPYEVHTFKTRTRSKWLNMLSHKLDAENPDIYKTEN